MKRVFRRPTPAMAVAIAALIAALGGTAVAGGVLNKKKVNNIITNRAPGLSVASAKKADSATNATNATNASNATNATNATNASTVGGQTVTRIFQKLPTNSAATTIYSANGLVISGGCTAGNPVLSASGPSTGEMQALIVQNGGTTTGIERNGLTTPADLDNGFGTGSGSLSYANTGGQVVTMTYGFDNSPNFGGTNTGCAITGTAIASG
jgi:hypothetical protein